MISLEKKQLVLIEYYQHNMSQRQIAEKLKMSRNTVKKYIEQDLAARQQDSKTQGIYPSQIITLRLRHIKNVMEKREL